MQVYKGLWNEVQDVAVKMVVGQSAEQQARFLREVSTTIQSGLACPPVLSIQSTSAIPQHRCNALSSSSHPEGSVA